MEHPKKLLILQEENLGTQKIKKTTLRKFLVFQEMNFSCPKLKKLTFFLKTSSYISEGNLQGLKIKNFLYFMK